MCWYESGIMLIKHGSAVSYLEKELPEKQVGVFSG